jgi:hypothetical protein
MVLEFFIGLPLHIFLVDFVKFINFLGLKFLTETFNNLPCHWLIFVPWSLHLLRNDMDKSFKMNSQKKLLEAFLRVTDDFQYCLHDQKTHFRVPEKDCRFKE